MSDPCDPDMEYNREQRRLMLDRLARDGGALISTGDATPLEIARAQSCGRMWVMSDGLGYILRTREWLAYVDCLMLGNSAPAKAQEIVADTGVKPHGETPSA